MNKERTWSDNRNSVPREFFSDADHMLAQPWPDSGYDGPWAQEKPKWIEDVWRRAISGGEKLYRRQADFHLDLATAFWIYKHTGTIADLSVEGRLLDVLRPGPISIWRSENLKSTSGSIVHVPPLGRTVERSLSWTDSITYSDPFHRVVGAQPASLVVEFRDGDSAPRWISHLGECFFYLLTGSVRIEWLVPKERGFPPKLERGEFEDAETILAAIADAREKRTRRDRGFERVSFELDADSDPHFRASWMKTECPHRITRLGIGPARALIFYSVPQGAHALYSTEVTGTSKANSRLPETNKPLPASAVAKPAGLGAATLAGEEDPKLWQIYSGIGARIERFRQTRGFSTAELALRCGLQAGHLSRIEDGLVAASIETAAKLAAHLEVPLSEILPDDVLTFTKGCYVNPGMPVWEMIAGSPMPKDVGTALVRNRQSRATKGSRPDYRVQIPYAWRDYSGLMVLPSGSPRAKSLTPLVLHIGNNPHRNSAYASYFKNVGKLARYNYELLASPQGRRSSSYSATLIVFVRHGQIGLRVARYADYHLFPFSKSRRDRLTGNRHFAECTLNEGDLLYLNCEHMHRFMVISEEHCALVCVLGRRRPLHALEIPRPDVLWSLLPVRSLDEDFATALRNHLGPKAEIKVKKSRAKIAPR